MRYSNVRGLLSAIAWKFVAYRFETEPVPRFTGAKDDQFIYVSSSLPVLVLKYRTISCKGGAKLGREYPKGIREKAKQPEECPIRR
jgi:hypothetical protein